MDYAVSKDTVFVTREGLSKRKKMSPSVRKRQEFLKTHNFSVSLDEETENVNVKITEKQSYE